MKLRLKTGLIPVIVALLLILIFACAQADGTKAFSIDLKGLTAAQNGKWNAVPLNQAFFVYDTKGALLGEVVSYATDEQIKNGQTAVLQLPEDTAQVVVIPNGEKDGEYAFLESYSLDFAQYDALNYPLLAYANKGFFKITNRFESGQAAPFAAFTLTNQSGQVVASFDTDALGDYQAQSVLPTGEYILNMVKAPQGAMLTDEGIALSIKAYTGADSVTEVSLKSQKIAAENLALVDATVALGAQVPSLLSGDQTVTMALTGFGGGKNSVGISDYTVAVENLSLLDGDMESLGGEIRISKIAYENSLSYKLKLTLLSGTGHPVGETITLAPGETAVVSSLGACAFEAVYLNGQTGEAVLEPQFDGGKISLALDVKKPMEDGYRREARSIAINLGSAWGIAGTQTLVTPDDTVLVAADAFKKGFAEISGQLVIGADHQGELTVANQGGIALPVMAYDLVLPEGFRVKEAPQGATVLRAKNSDVISYTPALPLAPGEAITLKMNMEKAAEKGTAVIYIRSKGMAVATQDNPNGLLIQTEDFVANPYQNADYGQSYTLVEVNCQAQNAFDEFAPGKTVAGQIYESDGGQSASLANIGIGITSVQSPFIYWANTDENGRYSIENLPETADLRLNLALPKNMVVLGLEKDEKGYIINGSSWDIQVAVTCSVLGTVSSEGVGIPQATVTIRGENGTQTGVTDGTGAYVITGLAPGVYTAEVELSQSHQNRYAIGDDQKTRQVTLTATEKQAQADFGFYLLGAVTIQASGVSDQGAYSCALVSDGTRISLESDAQGQIAFIGVEPGTYDLEFNFNGQWLPAGGVLPQRVTVLGGAEEKIILETVKAAAVAFNVEADGGDISMALNGENVARGLNIGESSTFEALYPGRYTLALTLPDGMVVKELNQWEQAGNSLTYALEVTPGEQAQAPKLTIQKAASIVGYIWNDLDANAAFTADEPGQQGIGMTLEMKTDGDFNVIAQTVTDAYGAYGFFNLVPGEYRVYAAINESSTFVIPGGESLFGMDGYTNSFVLTAGQERCGVSGGVVTPAPLKAVAFADGNRNGARGIYEKGIPGVIVDVLSKDGETVVATGTTDANGEVYFASMMQGECRVRFTLPVDYGFTKKADPFSESNSAVDFTLDQSAITDVMVLKQGQVNGIGVGAEQLGGVSGLCWYDQNGDGIIQDNEVGQEGVQITLVPKSAKGSTYTLITDATGEYHFNRVREGSYDLTVTAPEGHMFTRYSATGREKRSIFTSEGKSADVKLVEVAAGRTVADQNVGFVGESVIEGIVFIDENYNGILDEGEVGLKGAKVTLEKTVSNDERGQVTTGEDGTFHFGALRGNTYRLKVTLPNDGATYTKTVSNGVLGNHIANRTGRRDGVEDNILVGDADKLTTYVGAVYPGSISGVVYYDEDYSGDRQSSEKGAGGLEIRLKGEDGTQLDKTTTARDGSYQFADVNPGTYTLEMNTAKGSVYVTKSSGGNVAKTNSSYGTTKPVIVTMGNVTANVDAGLISPGTISGVVYADHNDNQVRDNSEGGYKGAVVTLCDENGNALSENVYSDDNGRYSFLNVMPGKYMIKCSVSDVERFTVGFTTKCQSGVFELKTGKTVTLPDIGALRLSKVSGRAFIDEDGNGTMGTQEKYAANVAVTLAPSRQGLETKTAITSEDGYFEITHLRPDEYTLTLQAPDGMVFSKDESHAYAARTGQGSHQEPFTIQMGVDYGDMSIGVVEPAGIKGMFFLDMNNNGQLDEEENLLSGHIMTLYDETAEMDAAQVQVQADGSFEFMGVLPSEYSIKTQVPENHMAVTGNGVTMKLNEHGVLTQSRITITSGEYRQDVIGGLVRLTQWGGAVYMDHGGESKPLKDTAVTLLNSNGQVVQTMTTGEEGDYTFGDLLPDEYRIMAQLPEGYLLVSGFDSDENRQQSTVKADNSGMGQSSLLTLTMGRDNMNLDIIAVKPGSLGDKAWFDENGNGLQETGERPVQGVRIEILRDGETIMEATTNEAGYYMLKNLYPSAYDVRITIPSGLKATAQRTDYPLLVNVLPQGSEKTVTLTGVQIQSGVINRNFDFGFVLTDPSQVPDAVKEIQNQIWQ